MPYADVNGVRLFYTDDGAGSCTLLLLHGLGSDSHDWNFSIPQLRRSHRVIACDLRGHGHSSAADGYGLVEFVEDMVALCAQLACEQVVPVGHSFGGAIAAVMAVEHPTLTQAVVEVDPAYALPDPIVQMWELGRRNWRSGNPGPEFVLPSSPVTPDFVLSWNERRRQAMDPAVFWASYEGLADGPQRIFRATRAADEYLSRRACPVLSFHSLPGRAQWETRLFEHPASHALEWEGSSHSLHVERPNELAVVLAEWLQRVIIAHPPSAGQPTAAERGGNR